MVTVGDWVKLQALLLDKLGIERLFAVVGGSLGGQQALEWALAYPDRLDRCIVLAASARLSAQGLAFNAVGRNQILKDPLLSSGDYYDSAPPAAGLAAARMLAHITYLSAEGMDAKFGRRLREGEAPGKGFDIEFDIEGYLDYQGLSFVERFDANSYLYISRAMDYYDAATKWGDGDLTEACKRLKARYLGVAFDSDWLYPPDDCKQIPLSLIQAGNPASYVNVSSTHGHDAFLIEDDVVGSLLKGFLEAPASCKLIKARELTSQSNQPELTGCTCMPDPPCALRSRWQDSLIEAEVARGDAVLDLGCGGGELLARLSCSRGIQGLGVELELQSVVECLEKGVPVFQADLNQGLPEFPEQGFDLVVLEETLQTLYRPLAVLFDMLRVGQRGIVSFPNFAHKSLGVYLLANGRMPVTSNLPYAWHNTPNIHLFTLLDFEDWCETNGVRLVKGFSLVENTVRPLLPDDWNQAEEVLLVIERTSQPSEIPDFFI
jgi:homoserine O-acetyltransferase